MGPTSSLDVWNKSYSFGHCIEWRQDPFVFYPNDLDTITTELFVAQLIDSSDLFQTHQTRMNYAGINVLWYMRCQFMSHATEQVASRVKVSVTLRYSQSKVSAGAV